MSIFKHLRLLARPAGLAVGVCLGAVAHAQDATWNGATTEWLDPANWNPNTVPTLTAIFSNTGSTTVANDLGLVSIGQVFFTAAPNAQAYTINIDNTFIINGAGVTNNSTNTQVFNVDPLSNAVPLIFQNSATANNGTGAVTYNNNFFIFFQNSSNAGNANTTFANHEIIQFNDTSTGGSANFTNFVQIDFFDSTSAANANITNTATGTITFNNNATAGSAVIGNASGGTIDFNNTSTAGSSVITNASTINFGDTSTAGASTINNNAGGSINFNDSANAGSANIANNSAIAFNTSASGGGATFTNGATGTITFNQNATGGSGTFNNFGGLITFNDSSTAGSANYTNTGAALINFTGTSTAGIALFTNNGGTIDFGNASSAASATITNNAGGLTFETTSTAGNANITNNSALTFRNSATAGNATIDNTSSIAFLATTSAGSATIVSNGTIDFTASSTAANATITTNSGGSTTFAGSATGGSARLITNAGGSVDISQLTTAGTTAGSIEGAGTYFLGSKQFTVGSLNTSTTVSGPIDDGGLGGGTGGSLDKVGTGTLTLTNAANTYTGATTVDAGTLTVNGSIALSSGVTVNSGATLNGVGTVSAVTINAGGTLMPGTPTSVGTLTGTGNVTFNASSSYQIFINGATSSKFTTAGGAALNTSAIVSVLSGSNVVAGTKYTILTATGGVAGTFNPTVTFGSLKGTLSYDADDVFLTFNFNTLRPLLPAGAPQNAVNVANAIDNFTTNGGTLPAGFAALFNLPPAQLVNGLEQLAGENSTGAQIAGFQLMNQFMALLLDPFTEGHGDGIGPLPFAPIGQQNAFTPDVANAYASVLKAPPAVAASPWRAWGAAYGGSESISGAPATVGSHDITARAGGFAAGLDYRASPDSRYGFALAGAGTGWNLAAGFGSGHSDAFQAGVYGTHQFGPAYVSGALAFTNFWASTKRVVTVSGSDTLQANFDAQSFGARLEGGYRLDFQPFTLTPYAALQAQSFHTPGYSETAASGSPQFALSFASQTSTAERAELGSWASRTFLLANRDSVTLFGRAAWAHDWFSNLAFTPSFQALPGASFVVNGVTPPADLGLVTAGAEWHMASNWSLMGRFDGEFGNGAQTYTGTARLRFTW